MRKQVFPGLCERLDKYHPDLCVVIELWFRGAFPVAQDEQERRLTMKIKHVCLVLSMYVKYV